MKIHPGQTLPCVDCGEVVVANIIGFHFLMIDEETFRCDDCDAYKRGYDEADAKFAQHKALWDLCAEFVEENEIRCEESIYDRHWGSKLIREFIKKTCDLVGYYKDEEQK